MLSSSFSLAFSVFYRNLKKLLKATRNKKKKHSKTVMLATISDKDYGKTAIWTILCFSPLPPLNNVEEQWAKLASTNVMGSQHCIGGGGGGGEVGVLKALFKIPIIFCHWLWTETNQQKAKNSFKMITLWERNIYDYSYQVEKLFF